MDERRDEDAQAGADRPSTDLEVGVHGAGQRDPSREGMDGQPDGRGPPPQSAWRVRMVVMVPMIGIAGRRRRGVSPRAGAG